MNRAEREQIAREMYLNGENTIAIHDQLHCGWGWLKKVLSKIPGKPWLEQKYSAMREYKAHGHTNKEVADKFGVTTHTAQQICKGIAPCKSHKSVPAPNKGVLKPEHEVAKDIEKRAPGFEYAGNYTGADGRCDIKCLFCGVVINRSMISIRKSHIGCPECNKRKAERYKELKRCQVLIGKVLAKQDKDKKQKTKEQEQARRREERETPHCCPVCGKLTTRPVYCSDTCANKANNKRRDQRRGDRIKAVLVDNDITVEGLFKRDKGVCWLCGKRCDFEDYITRDGAFIAGDWYPSIDHVIPLSKGGEHSWNNVKLAHRHCNTLKRDKIIETSTETGPPINFFLE